MIAAASFAYVARKKVAGVYDHAAGRNRQIAAEFRGDELRGLDGDRAAKFGGTLPEIYDAGDSTFVSFAVEGTKVEGYDRRTSSFYTAQVTDGVVQVYDHELTAWFAFDIQDADSAHSYHRTVDASG
jgi:hypothetical protein